VLAAVLHATTVSDMALWSIAAGATSDYRLAGMRPPGAVAPQSVPRDGPG
jgi:hypothetical protein